MKKLLFVFTIFNLLNFSIYAQDIASKVAGQYIIKSFIYQDTKQDISKEGSIIIKKITNNEVEISKKGWKPLKVTLSEQKFTFEGITETLIVLSWKDEDAYITNSPCALKNHNDTDIGNFSFFDTKDQTINLSIDGVCDYAGDNYTMIYQAKKK